MALEDKDLNKTSTTDNVTHYDFGQQNEADTTTDNLGVKGVYKRHFLENNISYEVLDAYYRFISNKIGNTSINNENDIYGGGIMSDVNWQEKYLDSLDNSIKEIKSGFVDTENRISDTIDKYIDYSTHLDKQRHEELLNLNNKIDDSMDRINDKVDLISDKMDTTNKWLIGLVIATLLSIAAMVISVISFISSYSSIPG